jgi:hypothetical protein
MQFLWDVALSAAHVGAANEASNKANASFLGVISIYFVYCLDEILSALR